MHGFPDNLHIWDDLVPYLIASGRRVVTFDFLGFGASDKPEDAAYSFKQQLGDLEAVVESLGLGKIVPLAHDSSGIASLNYALAHPRGVDSVIMLNSAYAEELTFLWPELVTLFEIYVQLAPAIPHAHHMHGHNLRRTGRTEEAIREFLKAEEPEEAYYRTENIPTQFDWHHAHNLQLLAMSYQALGRMKAAEAAYRKAFALPAYTDFAEFNRRMWPEFLLERGRAEEALAVSEELTKSKWALGRFGVHSLAGRALLAMNRREEARNELTLAEQELEQLPLSAIKVLPDSGLLRAEILLREKNWDKANTLMEKIEVEIVAVPGPDAWSEALFRLESIARVARETGDWGLAESTAKMMIQHDPSYAGGYLALGLVAEHRGDEPTAKQEFATAEKLWRKADAELQRSRRQEP
jgi:pimeloyl-ACP methyl ester carboxylesterase